MHIWMSQRNTWNIRSGRPLMDSNEMPYPNKYLFYFIDDLNLQGMVNIFPIHSLRQLHRSACPDRQKLHSDLCCGERHRTEWPMAIWKQFAWNSVFWQAKYSSDLCNTHTRRSFWPMKAKNIWHRLNTMPFYRLGLLLLWSIYSGILVYDTRIIRPWIIGHVQATQLRSKVCSYGTVFPSNRLELSPSLEYNSRDLSTSPMLKPLYLTLFSEVFTL